MDNLARFACKFKDCYYNTSNFNRLLNHCWDNHSLDPSFAYKCDVSSCTSKFTNIQRLRRHLKSKHLWFPEKYLQRYGRVENENVDLDENSENENVISMQLDESGVSSGENNESDCENVSFSDFDHEKLAKFLLELREIYGTTIERLPISLVRKSCIYCNLRTNLGIQCLQKVFVKTTQTLF